MTKRLVLPILAALVLAMVVAIPALARELLAFAHLTGAAERPTPVQTLAQGQVQFWSNEDETELYYRLNVANIENVTMAHIHLGPASGTGGIVVWLYPSAPPAQLIPGRTGGVLSTGTITSANLVGALAGQPLSALIDAIEAGNTYVNVHTSQYPAGEVRGQLHH